ncbi:MAG: hypothetical protein LUM44_19505 [Pyrinomonadaceae bacterium]|nr:hypothetical protein [Pyrinomonadaceae bacterium]
MKKKFLTILFLFSASLLTACNRQSEVTGEVFITTKSADTIKLSGKTAFFIPISSIKGHLEGLETVFESRFKDARNAKLKCAEIAKNTNSGVDERQQLATYCDEQNPNPEMLASTVYFENPPKAAAETMTDADGKFKVTIPNGDYAVMLAGDRKFDNKAPEYYLWIVNVEAKGEPVKITLTNANMVGTSSADSLIQDVDFKE